MELKVRRVLGDGLIEVGSIDKATGTFAYSSSYLGWEDAAAISFSLPLQTGPFDSKTTAHYFEGLLPEGLALIRIAEQTGVDPERYLDVLECIGQDCIADLVISADDVVYDPHYVPVSFHEIGRFAGSPQLVAESNGQARLSLAGTQDKAGLAHDDAAGIEGGWYRPLGGAGSSHIVKLAREHSTVPYIEYLCMQTARACGVSTPDTHLAVAAGEPLLVSRRYDRSVAAGASGIQVFRHHQEDMTQVFGMSHGAKYDEADGGSFRAMVDFLTANSSQPIADVSQIMKTCAFNYAIGNCDAHLKNFSVLYSPDWRRVRLAPAYDLVSTTRFQKCSRNLAMRIGDARTIDDVTPGSFAQFAEEIGVSRRLMRSTVAQVAEQFDAALENAYRAAEDAAGLLWYEYDNLQADAAERVEVLRGFAAG